MNKPLEIHFNGVKGSSAVEEHVREKVAKLEHFFPQMTGCRVTIAMPHNHQHKGNRFDVRIDVSVPGKEIVVNREQGDEDMYVTLREAFDAARKQLDSHASAQRDVKRHGPGAKEA
jgi:ribosomal subunit interface protein